MIPKKLAFVDLETTGGHFRFNRIIEVGIVRVEGNKVIKKYKSLVDPGISIPPFIEGITGIKTEDLVGAPSFGEIKKEILEILEDCYFVAHNVNFDYGFLRSELQREGISYSSKRFCTARLSRYLFPRFKRHNLDILIERHDLKCTARHRALGDAEAIADFYKKLKKELPKEKLEKAFDFLLKTPTIPLNISQDVMEALPETPGVYIFFGKEDIPLYIGKSKSIKNRVLSHFSKGDKESIEFKIASQITRIETIEKAGELGALFEESKLVKKMLPLYNRQLRIKVNMIALKEEKNSEGYLTVKKEEVEAIDHKKIGTYLGFFRSKKQLEDFLNQVCDDHELCPKLLGLEKSKKACFRYQLKKCRGACVNKEKTIKYNLRFIEAFSKSKIKRWPFKKAILIKEDDPINSLSEGHIFDNWCYLGSVKNINTEENYIIENSYGFDLDIYKILLRYITKLENLETIKQIDINKIFPNSTCHSEQSGESL